jgi:hypothetical protein
LFAARVSSILEAGKRKQFGTAATQFSEIIYNADFARCSFGAKAELAATRDAILVVG